MFAIADMITYLTIILASMFFDAFLRNVNVKIIIIVTNGVAFLLLIVRNLVITDRINVNAELFLYVNCFVGAFVGQISFLPFAIISAKLCPKTLEGTVYAFFMAVSNFAGIISRELSGLFTNFYDIRNTINFKEDNMDAFYILCFLLDAIGLIVILSYIHSFILETTYENNCLSEEDDSYPDSDVHTDRDRFESSDCIEDSKMNQTDIEI